jgi:hypothetical protein
MITMLPSGGASVLAQLCKGVSTMIGCEYRLVYRYSQPRPMKRRECWCCSERHGFNLGLYGRPRQAAGVARIAIF